MVSFNKLVSVLGLAACALGNTADTTSPAIVRKRNIHCHKPVRGLDRRGCERLNWLGMEQAGRNPHSNDGSSSGVWIGGGGGDTTFRMTNRSGTSLVLVLYRRQDENDYVAQHVKTNQPHITYSLHPGQWVDISMEGRQTGGFSAVFYYGDKKWAPSTGMIYNTLGEFDTKPGWKTVDVSRLVNMDGDRMGMSTGKCRADMDNCVFLCNSGNTCTENVTLKNCDNQDGGFLGYFQGAPNGGCLVNNDHVEVNFY